MTGDSEEEMDARATAEFADAAALEKFHRFYVTRDAVYFGLLGKDGVNRHFVTDANGISRLSAETFELSRLSRHLARGESTDTFKPSHFPSAPHLYNDGLVEPFHGPHLKFSRADVHFEALIDLMSRYSSDVKVVANEVGSDGEEVIWELAFSIPPPAAVPLMIGDIVHNYRSSLDLMICDLARIRGKSAKGLKLPFEFDEDAYNKRLKEDYSRLGDDVLDAMRDLKPWRGGNRLLRGLHDLDIIDKHQLLVPAYLAAWHRYDLGRSVADMMGLQEPVVTISDGTLEVTFLRPGERIRRKRGEDPLKYLAPHERGVVARFPSANSPFPGEEVIPTLDQIRQTVAQILFDFRTKFYRADPHS